MPYAKPSGYQDRMDLYNQQREACNSLDDPMRHVTPKIDAEEETECDLPTPNPPPPRAKYEVILHLHKPWLIDGRYWDEWQIYNTEDRVIVGTFRSKSHAEAFLDYLQNT